MGYKQVFRGYKELVSELFKEHKQLVRACQEEDGQAIVIVALAMGTFLLLGVGLAVDGSHIYSQRQMAQAAADAGAQAGIMSIFGNTAGFSTTTGFTCGTTDTRTPCKYASLNGFGGTASDTVKVSYPAASAAPGVSLSPDYATNLLQVDVTRNVNTTLMRLFGPTVTNVKATAMAAIVNVVAPVPIIVNHPTLTGSLSSNGGVLVTICGGPNKSVQVNSNDPGAVSTKGGGTVDLSHAGPPDPGNCTTGTGANFGNQGGPSSAPFTFLGGTTGQYQQPATWIKDPLAAVTPPAVPTVAGTTANIANGVKGCPTGSKKQCVLYTPGIYPTGIDAKNNAAIFSPGIYYVQSNGFGCSANCDMYMATGVPADGSTGTNTGWTGNMLVYNTGPGSPAATGSFNLTANGTISLVGSPSGSSYKGILFFEDRNAAANIGVKNAHRLGGGGAMTLLGTIYITNTRATMLADSTHYQEVDLQGTPGSSTYIQGQIIVDTLSMGGNAGITMNLNSTVTYVISQVALVN